MGRTKIAFVCEGNAGRSQLATALAEREARRRDLDVDVATGGVSPGDHVHEEIVEALAEDGIDVSDRTPRRIEPGDVADVQYVVTMGCLVEAFAPAEWDGTAEQWNLEHPSAGDLASVRAQRDEIRTRVEQFLDRVAGT